LEENTHLLNDVNLHNFEQIAGQDHDRELAKQTLHREDRQRAERFDFLSPVP
jgi:hypothetical protein